MTASTASPERPVRVCFLGESAAAGYLYAPHLTPARVLEGQLRLADPDAAYEVVDLARTNETLTGLAARARQAAALEADVLVVFAGNNWNLLETAAVSPYFPGRTAREALAKSVRERGILGPVEMAARQRLGRAAATLVEIQTLAQAAGMPVVWVIPEVNLADWWSRQPVAWLPGQKTAEWYRLYFQGREQLEAGEWETAAASAQRMIALDGSTCPTSYRLLAEANMGLGDLSAAREAGRAEVDSDQYPLLAFMSAPRITPLEQGLLRRSAREQGFTVVDLPQIFSRTLGEALPGRRLFLDYCHLTAEGMKVSMAAVTAALLRLRGHDDERTDWQLLLPRLPEPERTPAADATAYFGAAIHTAHRLLGARQPVLRHWCRAALTARPGMAETMLDFVRARLLDVPIVLTGAEQRNSRSEAPLGKPHGWQQTTMDRAMIQAIEATLTAAGIISAAEFRELLGPAAQPVIELAHPAFYHWEPLARFYPDVIPTAELAERPFYRSPWPRSSFCLLSDGRWPIGLDVTARLPTEKPVGGARVTVALNGRPVQALALGSRWQRQSVRLPAELLRAGINRVELRWPFEALLMAEEGTKALETAAQRLEQGLEAHFQPVFGEVFSLKAHSP